MAIGDWYLIDDSSNIYRRASGSTSWETTTIPNIPNIQATRGIGVHSDGSIVVVGIISGGLQRYWTYNGSTWSSPQTDSPTSTYSGITISRDGDWYASGSKIYRRIDGTWEASSAGIDYPSGRRGSAGIAVTSTGDILFIDFNKNIYRYSSGSWGATPVAAPSASGIPGGMAVDDADNWLIATSNGIWQYTVATSSWATSAVALPQGVFSPRGLSVQPKKSGLELKGKTTELEVSTSKPSVNIALNFQGKSTEVEVSSTAELTVDTPDDAILSGKTAQVDISVSKAVLEVALPTVLSGSTTEVEVSSTAGITVSLAPPTGLSGKTTEAEVSVSSAILNVLAPPPVILSGKTTTAQVTTSKPTVEAPATVLPNIVSFVSTPSFVTAEGSHEVTLSWVVQYATSVSIDGGIGTIASSGSRKVTIEDATKYTITATNSVGTATQSVFIAFRIPLPVVKFYLSDNAASNRLIVRESRGVSVGISWETSGATSVSLEQVGGSTEAVTATGSKTVNVSSDTTFILTATSRGGTVTRYVFVEFRPQVPIVLFTATPRIVRTSGGTSTLSWNVSHATSVSINQGIGTVSATGSRSITVTESVTYILTAINDAGTVTRSTTISFNPPTELDTQLDTLVSGSLVDSAFREATDAIWVTLVTLSHPDITALFGQDLRIVNDYDRVESRGLDYEPFPVEIILPEDTESGPPRAKMSVSNVTQEIAAHVRIVDSPIMVTFEIVNALQPDTVEVSYTGFTLRNVSGDVTTITGTLALEDLTIEPYPADSFIPAYFQGIFS